MKFANKLTDKQVKEFLEKSLNIKVRRVVLKQKFSNSVSCYASIWGLDKVCFSFSDSRFNFPYIKFDMQQKEELVVQQWCAYLTKIFGKEYTQKLCEDIDHSIELAKQLAEAKMLIIKDKSQKTQTAMLNKIDLLKTGIKHVQDQEQKDLQQEAENLKQEIAELIAIKTKANQASQEMEK